MRRFLTVLSLLSVLIFACHTAGADEWDPDRWIREQVELQYSEGLSGIRPADTGIESFRSELDSMGAERYAVLNRVLSGISVKDIQKLYGSGFMTVREYIIYCLKKADESEKKGMNIVIQVNPALMAEVEESCGKAGRPLYGIPVVLKANIGTAEGLDTTAGAAALKGAFLDEDPLIIKKIRDAGGIIFAKVNLSEWANYMTERSSNGFSSLGGQTRNPYGRFDVGGSSSGSAAAVAFGIAPLALGTETSGSVVYPASQNSVVGFKPALGEVSRDGIIPLADAQDTAGPMAGHVEDAVLLYGIIRGYDERDMSTAHAGKDGVISYEGLSQEGLKGLSVGMVSNESMEKYLYREGDVAILQRIRRELRHAGAKVTELNMDEGIYEELDVTTVFRHQFHEGVNAFVGKRLRGCGVRDLTGIVLFNEGDPGVRMPLGQTLLIRSLGSRVSGDLCDYIAGRNKAAAAAALDVMMAKADVLMTLSNYLSYVYAAAGYPAICVPAGYRDDGEPVGVTFITAPGEEKTLFEAAFSYESATGHSIAP